MRDAAPISKFIRTNEFTPWAGMMLAPELLRRAGAEGNFTTKDTKSTKEAMTLVDKRRGKFHHEGHEEHEGGNDIG